MNTRHELSKFWVSTLVSAGSRKALRKFSLKLVVFPNNKEDPRSFPFYAPPTDLFMDNMIVPGYFKNGFMDTLGPVAYVRTLWIPLCGLSFS